MAITDPNIPLSIKRVTLSERLRTAPSANGLIVYQTDHRKGFYYWENGIWLLIAAVQYDAGSVRPLNPFIGQSFFDTLLGFRIDWNGTNWVNGSGGGGGGLVETNIVSVGVNYNILLTDYIIVATADIILSLPQILTNIGVVFRIFSNGFNVRVNAFTGDSINGETLQNLSGFEMFTLRSLLSNKWLIGD